MLRRWPHREPSHRQHIATNRFDASWRAGEPGRPWRPPPYRQQTLPTTVYRLQSCQSRKGTASRHSKILSSARMVGQHFVVARERGVHRTETNHSRNISLHCAAMVATDLAGAFYLLHMPVPKPLLCFGQPEKTFFVPRNFHCGPRRTVKPPKEFCGVLAPEMRV